MKALPLLVSFAVVAAAAQADLKDPALVALDWSNTMVEAQKPLVDSLGLQAQVLGDRYPGLKRVFESSPSSSHPRLSPPPELRDAPAPQSRPDPLNAMPHGSKRWRYNGSDYWLVPLGG
ncbi:MAG TPA: hypothetical protein VG936_09540 [Lacunisphaera sp.]|nr:hypothetical protein [Lacunisphaera sp.]